MSHLSQQRLDRRGKPGWCWQVCGGFLHQVRHRLRRIGALYGLLHRVCLLILTLPPVPCHPAFLDHAVVPLQIIIAKAVVITDAKRGAVSQSSENSKASSKETKAPASVMLSAFTANGVIANLSRLSTTALIVDEGRAVVAGHTGDANAVNVSRMTEVRCYLLLVNARYARCAYLLLLT